MKKGGIVFLWFFFIVILFAGQMGKGIAASLASICQIQGSGLTSPRVGDSLQTRGVVTADFDESSQKGFFLQSDNCDGDPATSDGIFVYLGERVDVVSVGDLVEVSGKIVEEYGLTRIDVSPGAVQVLSSNNVLPSSVELIPPINNPQARIYFESHEGMLVSVSSARVVGPTDSQNDTYVIRTDLGFLRVFQGDPAGTGEVICLGVDGHFEIDPPVKVGDQILDVQGVLDYAAGVYRISLLAAPTQIPVSISPPESAELFEPAFTFGTFNLESLFDVVDDPEKDDPVLNPTEYHRKLEKLALTIHDELGEPAFLAVQEVENEIVLSHLLARAEIEADYGVAWLESPDGRGIDVALLYRRDKVTLIDFELRQGCTALLDGLGPDGDRNVQDPHNEITCDTDGDGLLDGNRLFSRPPLVVHFVVTRNDGENLPLWAIVNHWKSKREDTSSQTFTTPRRIEQAQFVAGLVNEIEVLHSQAAVIVLGDLNDYSDSQPLAALQQAGLWNVILGVDQTTRYTYIYQGVSQVLDHILVNTPLAINWVDAQPMHVNADYPYIYRGFDGIVYRGSDHDPVLVQYQILTERVYLPSINR